MYLETIPQELINLGISPNKIRCALELYEKCFDPEIGLTNEPNIYNIGYDKLGNPVSIYSCIFLNQDYQWEVLGLTINIDDEMTEPVNPKQVVTRTPPKYCSKCDVTYDETCMFCD